MEKGNKETQLRNLTRQRKVLADEKHKENSKNKLQGEIERRIKTAFIGSLATAEEFFGFLWGACETSEMTDNEKKIKKVLEREGYDEAYFESLYQELRKDILDKGHFQLKTFLQEEFSVYSVSVEKRHIELPVVTRKGDGQ